MKGRETRHRGSWIPDKLAGGFKACCVGVGGGRPRWSVREGEHLSFSDVLLCTTAGYGETGEVRPRV